MTSIFYVLSYDDEHRHKEREIRLIIDVTGIELIPGNLGTDCPGNGEHINENGELIECCCDECDYLLDCLETPQQKK